MESAPAEKGEDPYPDELHSRAEKGAEEDPFEEVFQIFNSIPEVDTLLESLFTEKGRKLQSMTEEKHEKDPFTEIFNRQHNRMLCRK